MVNCLRLRIFILKCRGKINQKRILFYIKYIPSDSWDKASRSRVVVRISGRSFSTFWPSVVYFKFEIKTTKSNCEVKPPIPEMIYAKFYIVKRCAVSGFLECKCLYRMSQCFGLVPLRRYGYFHQASAVIGQWWGAYNGLFLRTQNEAFLLAGASIAS